MLNGKVADKLDELAALMAISDERKTDKSIKFKIGSYKKAAKAIRDLSEPIEGVDASRLAVLKSDGKMGGVGEAIFKKVQEICQSGELEYMEKVKKNSPPSTVTEFMKIRGVGPEGARKIWATHGVSTFDELVKALESGKIKDDDLKDRVQKVLKAKDEVLLEDAKKLITPILSRLAGLPCVKKLSPVGGIRRNKDIVHDADILCVTTDLVATKETLFDFGEKEEDGDRKCAISIDGFRVEVTFCELEQWGAALFHFTGPQSYNIINRGIAIEKGWILSQNGLADREDESNVIAVTTEEGICEKLGIPFLVPELRDFNTPVSDLIKSTNHDLHLHTNFSRDGMSSIEQMVEQADIMGYKLIAITDHGRGLAMNAIKDFNEYVAAIRAVKNNKVKVWAGIEANIDKEGNIDYTDEECSKLDVVVASIHSHFTLSRELQTARLIKAIENKNVSIIGHIDCSEHGSRDAIDVDWDNVFDACVKNRVAIEINAQKSRTGFTSQLIRRAKEKGVKFCFGSDAHSATGMENMQNAIYRARRAGLTAENII